MNFIISIIMFAVLSIAAFSLQPVTSNPDGQLTFYVFGVILAAATVVMFVTMLFRNMDYTSVVQRYLSKLKKAKANIQIAKNQYEEYSEKFSDHVTKLYPDYEKEVFKSISPADANQLQIFMGKYPELKFNGVLTNYTNKLNYYMEKMFEEEKDVERTLHYIRIAMASNWYLVKMKLSDEITSKL